MTHKKPTAFTLIEMLVVITIIVILVSVAMPAYNMAQTRTQQAKSLLQARQIGQALYTFSGEYDGAYPTASVPNGMGTITTSNQAFSALFPTYLKSEAIFYNRAATGFTQATAPDNALDPAGTYTNAQTLKGGENAYAYVDGLSNTDNSTYPLVCDALASTASGTFAASGNGSTWKGEKVIVIHVDSSATIDSLQISGDNYIDNGNTGQTTKGNIFVKRAASGSDLGWLTDMNQIVNPIAGSK